MKKLSVFIFTILFLSASFIQAQTTYLYENFQAFDYSGRGIGNVSEAWTMYNDENEPYKAADLDFSYMDKAWKIKVDATGNLYAHSLCYFKNTGLRADRWLLTPKIDLKTSKKAVLRFKAMSADPKYNDALGVKLSSKTKAKEDFTVNLKTDPSVPGEWTEYTIDLSAYSGSEVYIAFIEEGVDGLMLYLDEVRVYEKTTEAMAEVGNLKVSPYVHKEDIGNAKAALSMEILNTSEQDIQSLEIACAVEGGIPSYFPITQEIKAGSVWNNASINYSFSDLGRQKVEVWVSKVNGKSVNAAKALTKVYVYGNSDFPKKDMFLEIFSSSTCSPCAGANMVLNPIYKELGANENHPHFSVIKYQVPIPAPGDQCIVNEGLDRMTYYGVFSAPAYYMNGIKWSPKKMDEAKKELEDSIAKKSSQISPMRLQVNVERDGNKIMTQATITAYMPSMDAYKLYVCFIEKHINFKTAQNNGERDFYNILRTMDASSGYSFHIPAIGDSIEVRSEKTFDLANPKIFGGFDNIKVLTFIQNTATREIILAKYESSEGLADEKEIFTDQSYTIYPNPSRNFVKIQGLSSGDFSYTITDLQGRIMDQGKTAILSGETEISVENLARGIYVLKGQTARNTFSKKLIKQ